MKQTTLNRVSATAACLPTEKAEIETQIAAPIKTDLNKHQAQWGFNKSADGSKVNRWWGRRPGRTVCSIQHPWADLADVDNAEMVQKRGVWGPAPRPPGFIALVPIPRLSRAQRNGVSCRTPRLGLGPRVGARVASLHCPVLRPGRRYRNKGNDGAGKNQEGLRGCPAAAKPATSGLTNNDLLMEDSKPRRLEEMPCLHAPGWSLRA